MRGNKCCICKKKIVGYGNNAWPVRDGRCCDTCNWEYVIPARLLQLYSTQPNKGEAKKA